MTTALTPPTPPPEDRPDLGPFPIERRLDDGFPPLEHRPMRVNPGTPERELDELLAETVELASGPVPDPRPDPHFCNDDCCCALALEAGDAEPPVPDELYNRLRRFLLEQASVLPTMLPVDAQATVVHLAIDATEQIENGFKTLVELVGDLAFERGWASHAMFAGRLAAASTAEPTASEHLAVVEGGRS